MMQASWHPTAHYAHTWQLMVLAHLLHPFAVPPAGRPTSHGTGRSARRCGCCGQGRRRCGQWHKCEWLWAQALVQAKLEARGGPQFCVDWEGLAASVCAGPLLVCNSACVLFPRHDCAT